MMITSHNERGCLYDINKVRRLQNNRRTPTLTIQTNLDEATSVVVGQNFPTIFRLGDWKIIGESQQCGIIEGKCNGLNNSITEN
jgi:hypothetical protein